MYLHIQLFLLGDLEAQTDGEGQADEEAQTQSGIEKFLNHLKVDTNNDNDDQVISPSISRNASAKSKEVLKVDEKLSNDDDDKDDHVISPVISRNASRNENDQGKDKIYYFSRFSLYRHSSFNTVVFGPEKTPVRYMFLDQRKTL